MDKFILNKKSVPNIKTHYFCSSVEDPSSSENFDCDDIIVDDCPEEVFHKIVTIRDVQNTSQCIGYCDHTISFPTCKSFKYDSLSKDCILYDTRLNEYIDLCKILGAGTDTVENCLMDDEKYPNICKVSSF